MPNIPWSDIPLPGAFLPTGLYHMKILEMAEGYSEGRAEGSTPGKLMYTIRSVVVEPRDYEGDEHFESYTIGSNDDPKADDPETVRRSFGAKLLRQCLENAEVPLEVDSNLVCQAAPDHEFLAVVEVEKREGFADRSRIRRTYRVGEREVGLAPASAGVATTAPVAPARPSPAAAPAPRPSVSRPVGRPPGPRPAAPPPPATPAARAPEKLFQCGSCRHSFPRSTYAAHVEGCNG